MIYHIIFICGTVLESLVEFIAKLFNISHLANISKNPKKELKNIFHAKFLRKTYDYLKIKYFYSHIKEFLSLGFVLLFIYSGLFVKAISYFTSHIQSPLLAHLLFIFCTGFIFYLILLPFSIIDSFLVEKKFGFSTITIKIFIMDNIKLLLLSLILGGGILTLIFLFIMKFQNTWWIWAWVAYTLFSLLLIKIYPSFIAPLFNKFKPIKEKKLKKMIMNMAKKAGFSITRILKSDASKRSTHSNAYFTGFGKNKQIVLFDTLLKQLTHNEIVGVLSHEIGHYKKKHIGIMFIIQTIIMGLNIFFVKQLADLSGFLQAFHLTETHYITRFIFSLIYISSIFWILQYPITWLSRKHEFKADNFSARTTGNPKPLINSLIKLTKDNLSNPYPHPFYSHLYYSHPPLIERIKNLKTIKL